jgi:hypothetical protein
VRAVSWHVRSGTHVVQVNYSGDRNHPATTSAAATLTILDTVGTFTLSPSTTTTTMAQGRSGAVTLTVTPSGGFHSTITFACTDGLPSGTMCVFAPAFIAPTDSTLGSTVLTISSAALAGRDTEPPALGGLVPTLGVVCAGMMLFVLPGRGARRWNAFILLAALSVFGVLSGCGSGGVAPNASSPLSTGSYTVTVRATGGSTIQTTTVNFTIQ